MAAVLAVAANGITVGGATIILRLLLAREAKREAEAAQRWKTLEATLDSDGK